MVCGKFAEAYFDKRPPVLTLPSAFSDYLLRYGALLAPSSAPTSSILPIFPLACCRPPWVHAPGGDQRMRHRAASMDAALAWPARFCLLISAHRHWTHDLGASCAMNKERLSRCLVAYCERQYRNCLFYEHRAARSYTHITNIGARYSRWWSQIY